MVCEAGSCIKMAPCLTLPLHIDYYAIADIITAYGQKLGDEMVM